MLFDLDACRMRTSAVESKCLRKLFSILLLALFGLPLASSLFAMTVGSATSASLPACCRRAGKHHCAMRVSGEAPAGTHSFRAPVERCPYAPRGVILAHRDFSSVATAQMSLHALTEHAMGIAQTECRWRLARDRSRQKRGPPELALI